MTIALSPVINLSLIILISSGRWEHGRKGQIRSWRFAMLSLLFMAALLQFGPVLLLHFRINGINRYDPKIEWWMRPLLLFAHLLRLCCDLLQIFVFTIAIIHSARYWPRDQRVFYWVARVEYTFLGILAIWELFHTCLRGAPRYRRPSSLLAISVLMRMVHVVSTSILLATSIRLKVRSNPEREESKALNWLVAGTTVLFSRSVVDKTFGGYKTFDMNGLDQLMFLAIIFADDFYARAVDLQSSDSNPMPVWLLSEVETEN